MITPEEIQKKAQNKFKPFLQSIVEEESFFPLTIESNKKVSRVLSQYQQEIALLTSQSKATQGYGYSIDFEKKNLKGLHYQDVPTHIYFRQESDFLKFIKKEPEVKDFKNDYPRLLQAFPELKAWVLKNPLKIIQYHKKWEGIIKVCQYFKAHPKPGLYIRELPIRVHTKFIEENKPVIQDLLNVILADTLIADEKNFEKRFHLKYRESLIRFRVLNESIRNDYFNGAEDLSIPVSQFNALKLPTRRVLVCENLTNFLVSHHFYFQRNDLVIFGKGYSLGDLKRVQWLHNTDILYWGDIDAQGFEILSQMRGYFPQTQSVLMDEATFAKYWDFVGDGTISKVEKALNLSPLEQTLYTKVKENNWRLEQERIELHYAKEALEACL